jgi:RNA polymerase sigma-70 factor (ECF subfamily)
MDGPTDSDGKPEMRSDVLAAKREASPTSPGSVDAEIAEEAVFDELFRAHYQAVFRLLYRLTGDPQEAEDLAQEAFVRLHRTRAMWDARQNVRGWLYRVAVNLGHNAARSRGRSRQRERTAFELESEAGLGADTPEELAIREDERRRVRAVLAGLPERQATLLLLRHAGLSYREVAEALGMAAGSVGTLLARAEEAFGRAYRAAEEEEGNAL